VIGIGLGVQRLQHVKAGAAVPSDGPAVGDGLLLETATAFFLLTEAGDFLLLE
jgi:hypothetical protein